MTPRGDEDAPIGAQIFDVADRSVNLLIKRVNLAGHWFRNFANYRLRLLLHCGVDWQTPQPARSRGRLRRVVA